jgi:hypothetical protein
VRNTVHVYSNSITGRGQKLAGLFAGLARRCSIRARR